MNPRPSSAWLGAALALAFAWVMPAARAGLSEATDFDGLWTTAGTSYNGEPSKRAYWTEQSASTLDGTDAVEGRLSSIDGDGESTWMETSVTGPATLYFSYRVKDFTAYFSTIEGSFVLQVGSRQTLLSTTTGNVRKDTGWLEATASIPAGIQKVQWKLQYYQGFSEVRAYVDQVWTSTDPRPRLAAPTGQRCQQGTDFSMVAEMLSATPATLTAVGLPPGLVADPTTFAISGTPTTPGTFEATLTTTNAAGRHSINVPFQVEPRLSEATDFDGPWTTGTTTTSEVFTGTTSWVAQSTDTMDGLDAVEGRLGYLPVISTWMETKVTGPATLYFTYRLKGFGSFSAKDTAEFSVHVGGGYKVLATTGLNRNDTGWREAAVLIPSGLQSARWRLYSRQGDNSVRAYVDQVWTSTDPRPRLTQPAAQTGVVGRPFSMAPVVTSSTPATLSATGLPPGLTADPTTFAIQGTPTTPGLFEASLIADNTAGQHITKVPIEIFPLPTPLNEGLDTTSLVFTSPQGQASWNGVLGMGHDGVDAARVSLAVQPGGPSFLASDLSTNVLGPGELTFWYRNDERSTSTQENTELSLSIIPGTAASFWSSRAETWGKARLIVPPGPQRLTWTARRYPLANNPMQHAYLYVYLDSVEFTPTTIPPKATFAAWTTAWAVGAQSTTSDSDGDGLPLLMEYGSGGSPYTPNPELLPAATIVDDHLTLQVTKAASPTDLRMTVQGSTDLRPDSWSTDSVEILEEDSTHLLVRSKKPISEQPSFHLRVHVLLVP